MGCHHGSLQGPIARRQVRACKGEDGGLQESLRDGELRTILPPSLLSIEYMADVFCAQVLFYEDSSNVREFQEKYKTYEDKFPACAQPPLSSLPFVQCIR